MKEWYECKVTYDKENEDGQLKRATEKYLAEAISFTDAEAVITKNVGEFISLSGNFNVMAVKKEKISEIVKEDGSGTWFKVKVAYISIDEESGKEKRSFSTVYFEGNDILTLPVKIKSHFSNSLSDYIIIKIEETNIIEIFETI